MSILAEAIGIGSNTIKRGMREIADPAVAAPRGRIRRLGGGKKPLAVTQPGIVDALEALVEPTERGDPVSPLRWTTKSVYHLAAALTRQQFSIGKMSVSTLLKRHGFSLQANRKTREGTDHSDRDAQFQYINTSVKAQQTKNQPSISVDTKKKENIGNYKNNGQEWHRRGAPTEVNMHDFPNKELGKAIPYGVYDLRKNDGWVNVGITHDTAQFAMESIRRWWRHMGRARYPQAAELLVTADSGGSNSARSRLWKVELQKLARETGLTMHVRHFPPGTSKWNKIEHRLFNMITKNWRGRPLDSLATVVNLIANTKTTTGLTVRAMIDRHTYETGIKVSDKEFAALNLTRDSFQGDWNYSIHPA